MYGGRNGVKTWSVARHLVIRGAQESIRVLGCREVMNSIKESVHLALSDQIKMLGLEEFYDIQSNAIYGKTEQNKDTRFVYIGMRSLIMDKTALKAFESFDVAWIEEAQIMSKASIDTILPTFRKSGSQIIFTFNPDLETDPIIDFLFRHPPKDLAMVKTSYRDNNWLSKESIDEMRRLKQANPEEFDHIYEGKFKTHVEGAIFAKELALVTEEKRIRSVPYDPMRPVYTFWDIGDRNTSIWFAQKYPTEYRLIEYMADDAISLDRYFKEMADRPYVYKHHVFPHDAKAPQLSTGKSIEEQARNLAGDRIVVLPLMGLKSQIAAARAIFPTCYFDSEKCADGLHGLRHYRWPKDSSSGVQHETPLHDWASHPGSAFQYFAVGIKSESFQPNWKPPVPSRPVYYTNDSWMG